MRLARFTRIAGSWKPYRRLGRLGKCGGGGRP